MRKIFTLFLFLVAAVTAMAEETNTFVFLDKNNTQVADGATITVSDVTEGAFDELMVASGLSVKNLSETDAKLAISYEVKSIDNGAFQICFPTNCISKSETGSWTTEVGTIARGFRQM